MERRKTDRRHEPRGHERRSGNERRTATRQDVADAEASYALAGSRLSEAWANFWEAVLDDLDTVTERTAR